MAEFMDVLRLFRSLNQEEKDSIGSMEKHLDSDEVKSIARLLKQKKISLKPRTVGIAGKSHILLSAVRKDKETKDFVEAINRKLMESAEKSFFREFSSGAIEKIKDRIAQGIVGLDAAKKAAVLQMFALDRIHLLLLGDPGTGKTEILRSAAELYPISSFGLGSGTSSTGLAVSVKGDEVVKGLLPMADKGLCCIDELNLMKKEDMASLYNAMEKGFVTYDKGGHHYKFDARVSVLATANPKGDSFRGSQVDELKKQLPFDRALLTRFHLVFLVRRPDEKRFREISRSIIKGGKNDDLPGEDLDFIKSYIREAEKLDITIPSKLEKEMEDFASSLKRSEDSYLIEISPRIVIGFVRMAKAAARAELRDKVEEKDIKLVKDIVTESLRLET
ncbi:MAG: ATP-binding protein [Candidatus Woesearchaeota archaeon]